VRVAPRPGRPNLEWSDDGMTRRLKVSEGMRVPRVFATPHVSTGQTYAKFHPGFAKRYAFLASLRAGRWVFD